MQLQALWVKCPRINTAPTNIYYCLSVEVLPNFIGQLGLYKYISNYVIIILQLLYLSRRFDQSYGAVKTK